VKCYSISKWDIGPTARSARVNVLRTPSDNRLIEMLRNARQRAGLTLRQLAERVRPDRALIARYEQGSSSHREQGCDD